MKKIILLAALLSSSWAYANVTTIQNNLKKNYPNLNIENIQPTEMKGIYSANIGQQIIYLNDDAQHILSGSMIRLQDKKDLTAELFAKQNQIPWNQLLLNDAIKIVKGNGKRKIALFSDPNCPACKKFEEQLKQLNNITVYVFVTPFKPKSVAPSKQVFCEKNPAQAWQDLIHQGIEPKTQQACANPIDRNLSLAKKLALRGTPTIVFENGFSVTGSYPAEQIEAIFKQFNL